MSSSKGKKPSVLNLSVFNFVKNYVCEANITQTATVAGTSTASLNEINSNELSDDGQVSVNTDKQQYESPIQSNDENELMENTFSLKINDEQKVRNNNECLTTQETRDQNECDEIKLLFKGEDEFNVPSSSVQENFLKGCKWSPDGLCILTNSNDDILRIFDFNEDLMTNQMNKTDPTEIKPSLLLRESGGVYDYAWYPLMNSYVPETACLFVTSKNNPIHLFDAYTGLVRCSYQGYNHLDELDNAYSLAFNPTCSRLYGGYRKVIKVFDITRPGKNYEDIKVGSYDIKLPGIISSIAFSQNGSYAAATYTKYIGIYIESNNELICMLQGHSGGVTHLNFSDDGNYLFSGARKDSEILCWDMRSPGHILKSFKRDVETNQRIYFDIDKNWKYLCSGNNDGVVNMWNLSDEVNKESEYEPVYKSFQAHSDCVNGVSFHPTLPVLATSSGQRKFNETYETSSDEENQNKKNERKIVHRENSLKIWHLNNILK